MANAKLSSMALARKRAAEANWDEIAKLHSTGLNLRQLQKVSGVGFDTIRVRLNKIGVATKSGGQIVKSCANCGEHFSIYASMGDHIRCLKCRGKNRWGVEGRQVECSCAQCGNQFSRKKSLVDGKDRSFCDRACQHKFMRLNPVAGASHHGWTGGLSAKKSKKSQQSTNEIAQKYFKPNLVVPKGQKELPPMGNVSWLYVGAIAKASRAAIYAGDDF